MAVGPFLTHDAGYEALLGSLDWEVDTFYAVLATTTESPDQATQIDYEDILEECDDADYDPIAVPSTAISVSSTKVQYDCGKLTFTADGSITARYLYILEGDYSSPANADLIIGHIDLSGAGNLSSVDAEFSFTPGANGLWEVARSAAPA